MSGDGWVSVFLYEIFMIKRFVSFDLNMKAVFFVLIHK